MKKTTGKRLLAFLLAAAMILSAVPYQAQAAENENLALGKTVTVSSYEDGTNFDGSKIVDGDRSVASRWGTGQNVAADEWAEIDLGAATAIKQIDIYFERADADQNVTSYKVEVYAGGAYETVYTKTERAAQHETIVLEEAKEVEKVKITVLSADGGTMNWVNVGIIEVEIYGEEYTAPPAANPNLALNKSASASNVEAGTSFTADKAVDGSTGTRWATDRDASQPWLEIDLDDGSTVKQVDIYFERSGEDQTVLSFKIEVYSGGAYSTVYTHQASDGRCSQHEKVVLDNAVTADKIKLTVLSYDGGTQNWASVSVTEFEVYAAETFSISDVVESLEQSAGTVVEGDTFVLPEAPAGFTIEINGADFEQIISKDLTVVRPLTDKVVQVSYVVTDSLGNSDVTGDIAYTVKGLYTQDAANNAKPVVIPEIQEWYSDSTEKLAVSSLTKVTYDNAALKTVVDEFVADYAAFTGVQLTAVQGGAEANAFNFSLTAPDALLGDEGYTMEITADRINVASGSTTGNMYGMQTILQMYKQDAEGFAIGRMRDYPRFTVRGLLLDIARKPISLEMVGQISRTMRYYKMNDLQVHLNDNYIWLEEYGTYANEDAGFNAYEAFRLESSLTNAAGEDPTAEDYFIRKADMAAFIQGQRALGMNIVPEIDVPAHALAFTKVWPELSIDNEVRSGHTLIDHFNLSLPESIAKIKAIFDDYTKASGSVPATFDGETTVHIGADEYYLSGTLYRQYFNEMVPYIKQTNTVRIWGSLTMMNDNNQTAILPEAIEGVQMNMWSTGWANFQDMYDMGFQLINTIDTYGYMVPNGNFNRGAYGDLLNLSSVFSSFKPNKIGSIELPTSDDRVLGAAFAIWNDNIDRKASGLSESDIFYRFFDALPFYAEKTWAATGQEKGSAAALTALSQDMGVGPRTNPYYQVASQGDVHADYAFNDLTDSSANDRDLTAGTAAVENGALVLNGGNSYVTTPIDKIGNGNALSFDITLSAAAEPGDILFEATPQYGTHDIRIMDNGKLGFTRELYNYYFNYTLPVGQTVNIMIVAEQQVTSLYVDGQLIGTATGKFIHNGTEKKTGITNATFAIPLERIGSNTNSIAATIDNVRVVKILDPADDSRDIPIPVLTATAGDHETDGGASEGPANLVLDEDTNTLWHTDWYGTSRANHWIQFELSEDYVVDGLRYLPRSGTSSNGTILEYEIQVSDDGVTFRTVTTGTWGNNSNWKVASFDGVQAKYVRLVALNAVTDNSYVFASAAEIRLTGEKVTGITDVSADPIQLPAQGGQVTVTVTGTDLENGIEVKAGDITGNTSGTDTQQTAILDIPANETTNAVTYTVTVDGTDKTVTVTVAAAEHTHVYDQEVTTEDYQATEATCQNAATYYYSCQCGLAHENDTFSYGEVGDHSYDEDDYCTVCGELDATKVTFQEVAVNVGEMATVSDNTGNYEKDVDRRNLDESIATVTVTGTTVDGTKTMSAAVTSIESGKQYILLNNRAAKVLNNVAHSANDAWGTHSGLKLDGTASAESTEVWTLVGADGVFTVMDADGQYLNFSNAAASMGSAANTTFEYIADAGYWLIKQGDAYLNDAGDIAAVANGWNGGAAREDAGSKWTIYEVITTPETGSTEIVINGVSAGETSVRVGDVVYRVTVTVPEASAVASVTVNGVTTEYDTIEEAQNAWVDGSTLTLLKDVSYEYGVNCTGKSVTLDLNGKTYALAGFYLNNANSALTIKDSSQDQSGKIVSDDRVVDNRGGTVTLESGTIESTNDSSDTVLFNSDGGSLYITGGTVKATGEYGSAVNESSSDGQTVISGGILISNSYAVNIQGGNVKVSGDAVLQSGEEFEEFILFNNTESLDLSEAENCLGWTMYIEMDLYNDGDVEVVTLSEKHDLEVEGYYDSYYDSIMYYTGTVVCKHSGGTATCEEQAVCDNCGEGYGEVLGHSFTTYVSNNDATCTADGTETAKCDRCDETDSRTVADSALGHSFTSYVSDNNATCTADGTETAKCDRCDETDTRTVADSALGHSFTTYVSNNDATCTADGTETAKCDRCDETDTRTVADSALGHTPAEAVRENEKAATCSAEGSYDEVVYCSVCNEELSRTAKTIDKLAHTEAEPVRENEKAATCSAEGSYDEVVYCSVCNEELTRTAKTIDKLAHTEAEPVRENEKAATCTAEGSYDEVVYCSVCDEELSREAKTIGKLAHTEAEAVRENEKAVTCTAEGSYDEVIYCSVCDEELSRTAKTIAKLDHEDTDKDHLCDSCDKTLTECVDENKDYKCDICGKDLEKPEDPTDPTDPEEPVADSVVRLSGAHRWATSLMVADEMKANLGVEKFDAIIIASGNDFADALAGSYLSTVKNAPILLAWGKGGKFEYLDTDNIEYIKANLAEGGTVYILGGVNAVPELYENELKGYTVKRLGGANRFETNLLILEEAGVAEGSEVLVCTSTNFADSLSASATGMPILLVFNEYGKLYGKQPEFLAGLKNCTFTVIGGESAVSADLAKAIEAYGKVERLAGANRFETSVLVAEEYFENPETAVLAYAWNYPDGLCGGSLAFSLKAPLILTMTKYEAQAVEYAESVGITTGIVLGGDTLISDDAVRAVFAMDAADEIIVKK